ncbi:MAG: NADH-quinone oxidoreductase subunit NuoF [Thermaerobacter sp.]|nr:NADH-quinone oxidoreductase subunit NuoF [Thermaerobacter sp.]
MFEPVLTRGIDRDLTRIENYVAQGGFTALTQAVRELTPQQVVDEVTRSNLRGRGGAGFPAGRKWGFLPQDGRPRYLACNADEGEPGTFKDHLLIDRNPFLLLEGIAIACYAIGAHHAFIYIRGEFLTGARILEASIAAARSRGYLGERILGGDFSLEVTVHRGAGSYECGEETALLESLEGKRGNPRLKPPFPAVAGAYGMPTVINNVETLCCVPSIVERGAAWFAGIGPAGSPGPKLFAVSGLVLRPGNYELPMGTTLRELIFQHAGGLREGRRFKAVLPGGSSSPALVEEHLDTPLDFDSVARAGSMFGSGAVMVLDDSVCMVRTAWRLAEFYRDESCGKCTPCREGTYWITAVLERLEAGGGREEDPALLEYLAGQIGARTFCPLGDAAIGFLLSSLKYFPEEYAAHIRGETCRREVAS